MDCQPLIEPGISVAGHIDERTFTNRTRAVIRLRAKSLFTSATVLSNCVCTAAARAAAVAARGSAGVHPLRVEHHQIHGDMGHASPGPRTQRGVFLRHGRALT